MSGCAIPKFAGSSFVFFQNNPVVPRMPTRSPENVFFSGVLRDLSKTKNPHMKTRPLDIKFVSYQNTPPRPPPKAKDQGAEVGAEYLNKSGRSVWL